MAFEADSVDTATHAGWSVTVVGYSRAVTDSAEIRHLEEVRPRAVGTGETRPLHPDLPGDRERAADTAGGQLTGDRRCGFYLSGSWRSCSARCPDTPRVVAGGNFATPWRALAVLDGAVARYRLFALNAQAGNAGPGRA